MQSFMIELFDICFRNKSGCFSSRVFSVPSIADISTPNIFDIIIIV